MHVLITGAGGHLGGKLFEMLESDPAFDVSGLDVRTVDHPRIHVADLTTEGDWLHHLDGVDVVVHLAGDREPTASWASAIRNNMDATLALYEHCAARGVGRVVLASSNWLHGDKRFTDEKLTAKTPPGPINAYGMSKLFCERTGAYFARHRGLSVVCMRIGWTQWTHNNQPGRHMAMGRWGQDMWLSDRDFLDGMKAAVTAPDVTFAVLNLMSNNPDMRWDMSETENVIGFTPRDGSAADVSVTLQVKSLFKKLATHSIPRWFNATFPDW
jgi:nucleoside-diphosphate-sugar epimerase